MTEKETTYYKLLLIRQAEQALIKEYPSNAIKTPCHLAIGAEAIAVGVCTEFPGSKIFATYRNHHWYLACGGSLENFFLELYGKKNPIADGKAGSMHLSCPDEGLVLTSAVVATQISPAIGHAFAMKYKGKDTLTVCALGDGATEEGVFYEALNLAKLHELKILFVVEDNGLAIHQHKKDRQAFTLGTIAKAYKVGYRSIRATEYPKVAALLSEINKFPHIVHFGYHRFMEHVGINEDYNAGYRTKPQGLEQMDPVSKYRHLVNKDKRKLIEERVAKEISDAVAKAQAGELAQKESLLEHVFA